ncbi:UDP-glucuronosyltransferase 2B33-like [Poecilia formosa]|uniref:UDP-glucuronosyltransferase 2B33-like n=1 Tax=Poecilia formosa TaxID=48698 RepID=UPI0007BA1B55|nr:PREDICTED: UDP-glucuronosyltransferase 2B33-like [Poecilia formosa]
MSKAVSGFPAVLCCLVLRSSYCKGSKILVLPHDWSHWINMKVILEELHSRGHKITVLHSTKSWFITNNSSIYTSIHIPSLLDDLDPDFYVTMMQDVTGLSITNNSSIYTSIHIPSLLDDLDPDFYVTMMQDVMDCRDHPTFIRSFCQHNLITLMLKHSHKSLVSLASEVLQDKVLIKKLKDAKFDLMLTDPAFPMGVILGGYLKLPMVFNVRWINNGESHQSIAPSPVSYAPVSGSELHDQMDFLERTKNMLHYLYNLYELYVVINPTYTDLFQKYFPPGTDLVSSYCKGSKILVLPVDGSHWINMKVILEQLHSRGHKITVLHSANSWYITNNPSIYTSIHVPSVFDEMDRDFYAHLQSAGFGLPWFSYFCLDVAVFLLAITGTSIWSFIFVCRLLCCKRSSKKLKPE